MPNVFPKLHNAMWPGLVGKGSPGAEPFISLDRMLELTTQADVNGQKFEGIDLFLFDPHINIDLSEDDVKRLADKVAAKGLNVGSVVAPVWPGTVGDSSMGGPEQRAKFVLAVKKACRIADILKNHGVRKYGVIRIDAADGPSHWASDPAGNTRKIASTFREAAIVAAAHGERLAAEGEICWAGMHSWKNMVDLLEQVDMPGPTPNTVLLQEVTKPTIGKCGPITSAAIRAIALRAPSLFSRPPTWAVWPCGLNRIRVLY